MQVELIIDTIDAEERAMNLLLESGVNAVNDGVTTNLFILDEKFIQKVEEVLAANDIEFQWSSPDDEEMDDYYEDEEE
jgi:hypothetical protein